MAKKRSICAASASSIGFPDNTLGWVSCITVYGSNKAVIEECEAVVECSESYISVRVCDGMVYLRGEKMIPIDFKLKTLSVSGDIKEITFDCKDEKGEL